MTLLQAMRHSGEAAASADRQGIHLVVLVPFLLRHGSL